MSDVPGELLGALLGAEGRLFVVSNRGPITFHDDPSAPEGLTAARGSGGLVTALADLGRHAPITWVACALTPADRRVAPALRDLGDAVDRGGEPAAPSDPVAGRLRMLLHETVPGQDLRLHLEALPESVYTGYYETVANPFLWFLQHQMYSLPYEPNVDRRLMDAWRTVDRPVFLLQDYHLYLAAERIRERRPDATVLHFTHIPWPPAGIWQVIPQAMRRAICEGMLAADIVGLQTDRYASHFLDSVA